jgi:hypothetical protein
MDPIILAQGFSTARQTERLREAREIEWRRLAHERAGSHHAGAQPPHTVLGLLHLRRA